jgi:hypothetical protein
VLQRYATGLDGMAVRTSSAAYLDYIRGVVGHAGNDFTHANDPTRGFTGQTSDEE